MVVALVVVGVGIEDVLVDEVVVVVEVFLVEVEEVVIVVFRLRTSTT